MARISNQKPRTPDKSTPKRTIDRWLSPSSEPVPAWAELEIRKLMGNYCAESITNLEDLPQTEDLGKMFITLEPNVQDLVHQEAYRLGLTVTALLFSCRGIRCHQRGNED